GKMVSYQAAGISGPPRAGSTGQPGPESHSIQPQGARVHLLDTPPDPAGCRVFGLEQRESATVQLRPRTTRQGKPTDPHLTGAGGYRRGRATRGSPGGRGAGRGAGTRPRPGRGGTDGPTARGQDHGLRQVQVRGSKGRPCGQEEAARDP